jgi:hypothetical protein
MVGVTAHTSDLPAIGLDYDTAADAAVTAS